jgi:hypothetical protein
MDADDIRWSEATMLWARHGQPRDEYDEAVFARLDAAKEPAA